MNTDNKFGQARKIMSGDFFRPTAECGYGPAEIQHRGDVLPGTDTLEWCCRNGYLCIPTYPDVSRLALWTMFGVEQPTQIDSVTEQGWIIVKKDPFAENPVQLNSSPPLELVSAPIPLSITDIAWITTLLRDRHDQVSLSAVKYTINMSRCGDVDNQSIRSYVTLDQAHSFEQMMKDFLSGTFKPYGWKL